MRKLVSVGALHILVSVRLSRSFSICGRLSKPGMVNDEGSHAVKWSEILG